MDELAKLLKDMAEDGVRQDRALLDLCTAIIERHMMLVDVVASLSVSVKIQADTIKTHNQLIKSMRETIEAYTKRTVN